MISWRKKDKESKLPLPVASELCPWLKKEKREERKSYQSLSDREREKKSTTFVSRRSKSKDEALVERRWYMWCGSMCLANYMREKECMGGVVLSFNAFIIIYTFPPIHPLNTMFGNNVYMHISSLVEYEYFFALVNVMIMFCPKNKMP